jgi:hypothetical protein
MVRAALFWDAEERKEIETRLNFRLGRDEAGWQRRRKQQNIAEDGRKVFELIAVLRQHDTGLLSYRSLSLSPSIGFYFLSL